MWSIIDAAGWPIWAIIVASVIALAIILERLISLRLSALVPKNLLQSTKSAIQQEGITPVLLNHLEANSALGRLFGVGLRNASAPRGLLKEIIEDQGRVEAIQLERFLTTLGTIAAVAPLLGLFGTVIGLIEIFDSQSLSAGANPASLGHGISVALYNTAFGLIVAVPSMIFYRYFRAKVEHILVAMEAQTAQLMEVLLAMQHRES